MVNTVEWNFSFILFDSLKSWISFSYIHLHRKLNLFIIIYNNEAICLSSLSLSCYLHCSMFFVWHVMDSPIDWVCSSTGYICHVTFSKPHDIIKQSGSTFSSFIQGLHRVKCTFRAFSRRFCLKQLTVTVLASCTYNVHNIFLSIFYLFSLTQIFLFLFLVF